MMEKESVITSSSEEDDKNQSVNVNIFLGEKKIGDNIPFIMDLHSFIKASKDAISEDEEKMSSKENLFQFPITPEMDAVINFAISQDAEICAPIRMCKIEDIFLSLKDILTLTGEHWLNDQVIDNRTKEISYYDSLGNSPGKCLEILRDFMKFHVNKITKCEIDYKTTVMQNIPKQKNGYDCGIFLLTYAEFISRNLAPSFTQEDVPHFRKLIMFELLSTKLLSRN